MIAWCFFLNSIIMILTISFLTSGESAPSPPLLSILPDNTSVLFDWSSQFAPNLTSATGSVITLNDVEVYRGTGTNVTVHNLIAGVSYEALLAFVYDWGVTGSFSDVLSVLIPV